jgi:hypothetical protein
MRDRQSWNLLLQQKGSKFVCKKKEVDSTIEFSGKDMILLCKVPLSFVRGLSLPTLQVYLEEQLYLQKNRGI